MKKHEDKSKKSRYIFMFQLASQKLELFYDPTKSEITTAWKEIQRFFKKHKFEHLKDTTYISKSELSEAKFYQIINSLFIKNSWLALSNDTMKCYSINKEIDVYSVIAMNRQLVDDIHAAEVFPPRLVREDFSLESESNRSAKQQENKAKQEDTVTVSISELKECFEADVELQVTVKKSDLEKAKKQAEAKKQSNTKSEHSEKSEELPEQNKPRSNRKPTR